MGYKSRYKYGRNDFVCIVIQWNVVSMEYQSSIIMSEIVWVHQSSTVIGHGGITFESHQYIIYMLNDALASTEICHGGIPAVKLRLRQWIIICSNSPLPSIAFCCYGISWVSSMNEMYSPASVMCRDGIPLMLEWCVVLFSGVHDCSLLVTYREGISVGSMTCLLCLKMPPSSRDDSKMEYQ